MTSTPSLPLPPGEPPALPSASEPVALTLRPAGRGDLAPLSFFYDTLLRRDYFLRRGQLAEMLTDQYHQVYIAELGRILVGMAITTAGSQLVNVLVHPAYRGLGVGRALVERSGARTVRAKLDMHTGDPRPFYRALGFVSTGTRSRKGNVELMRRRGRSPRSVQNISPFVEVKP